ncbi:STAG-domain-containing protein [Annulohypoxylon maeteangense]|uniref:STAG-domain-containing protein n=1 Tax=Annulohypoxylon maeteangense TaxID=1927788 RepID=UPI002008E9CB|nr:STAG-domain-containing protein [Annulohypoxylon maeteangense]KAI0884254.1 STAG-domain-containing protein [Annulohypoxylon maeteangense]
MSPSRLPLMETSDNNATSSPASAPDVSRRRSGRVVRAPQKFSPEPQNDNSTSKRKRGPDRDEEDGENESPAEDEDEELSDPEEEEDAEEESTSRSKRSKSKQKSRSKKPAAKRAKVNGSAPVDAVSAPNAPAVRLPNRPKKTVRVTIAHPDGDGLYVDVFGSGDSSNDVATHWFQRYEQDNAKALTDVINCVLLAAGCDQQLTEDDIQDPDNSANRLSELEDAYQQTNISDYPLISRAKSSKNFRELLVGFFESLVNVLHETDVLYNNEDLLDNIQRWVGIMSSSSLRPFRHTATTVGLAILSSLIAVAKSLDERITKSNQALQAESGRRGKNKHLVENTKKALDAATRSREFVDGKVKDLFDIVFVHRYRDIDPKIRAECIEALGTWICTLPTVYMSPEYLRYLGWLLSDVSVSTRLEVLKQLARVLKRDAEKLAHFIDRFRPRLVEMATKDSDISVRVAAIGVVDILRASGMLEPEEVDSVSKLLFDSELRIRKAVVGFFSALVQELIDTKIDDIGGSDALEEVFGDEEEDDYDSLRKDWVNIKALAENLAVYDAQLDDEQDEIRHGLDVAADVVNANTPDSRIALATQVLHEKIPEISNWQILAGYLLFDHSTSAKSRQSSKTNSVEAATKKAVAPDPREEVILLEVLAAAVKESLLPSAEHDRHKKKTGRLDTDAQEDAGVKLASLIPRLLSKFGSDPAMAATVLRLEHFLDLEVFQQLRQNSATYDKLLDEITTQFNRHVDQALLNEAATALIHARQYEELEEVTDNKLAVLWDNSLNSLRGIDKICELSSRLNLDRANLTELSQILMKISKLVAISDCVDVLETPGTSRDSDQPAIKILTGIVHRGLLTEPNEELDDPEDEIVAFAIKASQFYFMWKVRRLRSMVENNEDILDSDVDQLVILRRDFVTNLIETFSSRGFNDDLRLFAVGTACDLCGLFVFLRPVTQDPQTPKYTKLRPLLEELPQALITQEIIPIFDAAERAYAKRGNKQLNEPLDDEDPLDDELPPEDDDEEELTEQERFAAELKAEKILCELTGKLVLAILAKTIDHSGPDAGKLRKRLNRNKTKLGNNYKDIVAYLDEDHLRELRGGKKKPAAKAKGKEAAKKPALSAELVIEDDDDDENPRVDDPFDEPEAEAEIEVEAELDLEPEPEPEEGTVEDLRQRELLDDPIEDDEDEERPAGEPMEDDDVIGD